jgi:predicted metalloendopeptidase
MRRAPRAVRILVTASAVLAASATGGTSEKSARKPASEIYGINLADMDPSISACQNLNQYGNGGWIKSNPTPPDQSFWVSFVILNEQNHEKLHKILEKAAADKSAAAGSEQRKIGDFWSSCMDEAAIEAEGLKPVQPELAAIDKIAGPADLQATIAREQTHGINTAFQFTAEQDRRKSTEVIAIAAQGGLGLPERDYYLKTDDASKTLRDQYVNHVANMFGLMGETPSAAAADAKTVMAFEKRLAEASMTAVEQRDPDATYNRKTLAELATLTPNFNWTAYFQTVGATPAAVNVSQPRFFEALNREITSTPLAQWKAYLRWHYIHASAPYLTKKFVDENFAFYEKALQGTPELQARWKRCVTATDGELGQALGHAFVNEYFPPSAKARADSMVHYLIGALREDLTTLTWMGEATRAKALEKLTKFNPKIGYPDRWRDYSSLRVDRGPFVLNVQRAEEFEFRRQLAKVGTPVDRQDWQMTPPQVDAYYDAQLNEIVFPAGILQPPFFDPIADDAVNFGAMGAVIGHEMTHGFDDEGRKFDGNGNMVEWWTPEDLKNYLERSRCVEEQYASYVYDGQNVNGKLVLGEATADLGGLGIAYRAYRKTLEGKPEPAPIDGLTGDQRFFLGWARVWAANVRPEVAKLLMNTNPHPLPQFRAIGPPSTLPEFAKAFGCKPGDPMVRKDLCQIW